MRGTDLTWTKKKDRLRNLAKLHNIEQQMDDVTKGYTDFRCVKDWKRLANFIRSLRRIRDVKIRRDKRDQKHRELAMHLRQGLSAGSIRNFVRALDNYNDDHSSTTSRSSSSIIDEEEQERNVVDLDPNIITNVSILKKSLLQIHSFSQTCKQNYYSMFE